MAPSLLAHARSTILVPRSQHLVVETWSTETARAWSQVADTNGNFNGSCTTPVSANLSPDAPPGACSAYYAEVTLYCCGAVGGGFKNTTIDTSSTDYEEPICTTTSWSDMLSCYKDTSQYECGMGDYVIGVCNPQPGVKDTSRTSGAGASRRLKRTLLWGAAFLTVAVIHVSGS